MAHVTVDKDLVALMSAVPTGSVDSADGKHKVFSFDQKIPIPSYLIALAVGALVSKDIGPRSKVWSEAEMVEAGAFEFAETEKFISIAEDLVGKYVWGQYDVLLLPPSFPYGGTHLSHSENYIFSKLTTTLAVQEWRTLASLSLPRLCWLAIAPTLTLLPMRFHTVGPAIW